MKYTNIKKLLIKFMGGGLINFPTRFLRWIKIDGDAEGDDGGGDGGDGESSLTFLENMVREQAIKPIAYAYYSSKEDKYYIADTSNFNSIPDIVDFIISDDFTYDRYLFALYGSDENFDNNSFYLGYYDCDSETYGSLIRFYNNKRTLITIDGNNYYIIG